MVECSPATRAARVRFPADALFLQIKTCRIMIKSQLYAHIIRFGFCVLILLCSPILLGDVLGAVN